MRVNYQRECYNHPMSTNTSLTQTLKGFRDFLPSEKRKRDFVEASIKHTFEQFGFEPIETPTLEYAALLLGKYGDEADKLVYTFEDKGERRVGLRYDQTVPTARVLGQYQHLLPKYFRRYQIQNVFRADKPQKGRYREFTQCDCDVFGPASALADAEILAVYYAAFKNLGITSLVIEVNDRQTLMSTLSPFTNEQVNVFSLIQSVDKLDKQTPNEVAEELVAKGLPKDLALQALEAVEKAAMSTSLQEIVHNAINLGVPKSALHFNPKLARGLDYYTGLIFEGKIAEYNVGSVGGGGRYDNLLNDLGGVDMPAVGFAIGFDRTVEAVEQLGLIPENTTGTQVLVALASAETQAESLTAAQTLRQADIRTEVFPALDKLGKQFKVADQKHIPFVLLIGELEKEQHMVTVKNLRTEAQVTLTLDEAITLIQRGA
jgi:histidyl-tRNA synthetase